MGWQDAGEGSKVTAHAWQWKVSFVREGSLATNSSTAWISALVVPHKGGPSHPTQAQLLSEMGVLPWSGVKIWGLEIADKAQSRGETELRSSIFTQTKVPLKAVRH